LKLKDNNSVLVIGGAGYLGSVLVEELLARGYAVTVFDRLFFGAHGLKNVRDRIRLIAGDVRAMDASVFQDVRAVINLSGLSNDPTAEYNPEANYQMNAVATKLSGQMAKQAGIQRYIFASSCSIYDIGVIDEERDILLNEESPVDPHAAYGSSKLAGEKALFALADASFAPTILRMGTLFGFSPRMRYDLVVNTFMKDALSKGYVTLHYGGQMWRPMVDIRDAARAYIAVLEADQAAVGGQLFNIVSENFRISELALRVRDALAEKNIPVQIKTAFEYTGVRNYRVSGKKIWKALNYKPVISVQESVKHALEQINLYGYNNFERDWFYNIRWMKLLEEIKATIDITGTIFEMPAKNPVPQSCTQPADH
jgi:nucleoside-diphosphate-sugar epimerase